jgi:hypothetical protein
MMGWRDRFNVVLTVFFCLVDFDGKINEFVWIAFFLFKLTEISGFLGKFWWIAPRELPKNTMVSPPFEKLWITAKMQNTTDRFCSQKFLDKDCAFFV